jgi:hypothetical protein
MQIFSVANAMEFIFSPIFAGSNPNCPASSANLMFPEICTSKPVFY